MTKITDNKVLEFRNEKVNERYTLGGLISDFFYNLWHLERKKWVYTAIDLTLRPGKSIHKVLDGYRQYLFQPLEYLIVVAAIISVLNYRYHFFANEFTQADTQAEVSAYSLAFLDENKMFFDQFFKYSEENPSIVNIVAIPVFTLCSYVFFLWAGKNFAENIIINTFVTAQQLLFLIFLVPFDEFIPNSKHILIPVYTMGTLGYNIWVYVTVFDGPWPKKIISALATVSVGYVAQFPANIAFYYFVSPLLEYIPEL